MADSHQLEVGVRGTVTIPIPGQQGIGEVELPLAGGTCTAIAYADEPIARGTEVVVIQVRVNRRVDVTPIR